MEIGTTERTYKYTEYIRTTTKIGLEIWGWGGSIAGSWGDNDSVGGIAWKGG